MKLELATEKMIALVEDRIGWMIYNNPARHNALSLEMQQAVPPILGSFAELDEVRVVVLRGAGERAFVSGADISEFEELRSTVETRERYDRAGVEAGRALALLEKPVIAMIQGFCMGGGLATALHADLRIASDDAQFGIPAARLGVGYRFGGIQMLVDLVGPSRASDILFSARRIPADEALQMGLVNRVVNRAELEPEVRALAANIAGNAPLTVKAAKFAIRQVLRDPAKRDLERCEALVEACFRSGDYVEGRRAFLEKRPPVFRGC